MTGGRWRRTVLALALVLSLPACSDTSDSPRNREERNAPPDAGSEQESIARVDARLEGRVVTHDGRPVSGVTVQVTSQPTASETAGGLFAFVFTAGFACILSDGCFPTGRSFQTVTDADGRYAVALPEAHIPGYEADTDWFAGVRVPPQEGHPNGASSVEEFEVASAVQASPDLLVWDPPLRLDANRARYVVRWTPLDPASFDGRRVRFSLVFGGAGGGVLWAWTPAQPNDVLDARILEDARGEVTLSATGDATSGPTIYHRSIVAPTVAFTGTAGAPPSRGAACSITDIADVTTSVPCWLTDGDLVTPRAREPALKSATVDLGREADVGLVVVRGCPTCAVELSRDGTTWDTIGHDRSRGAKVITDPGRPARYVRLTGGSLEAGSEVSVWPPLPRLQPAENGQLPDSAADEGDAAADGAPRDDDDVVMVLAGMALVLLLFAAGAVGWAVSRRRAA